MKEYKISVKLNTLDMYSFLMRHEYGSVSGLFGLGVSLVSLVALLAGVGRGDRNMQILLGLAALCFTVFNPLRLFFRAQKQLTLNPTFHKPIEYTFGEAGMHIAQGEEQMDVAWIDMKKLVHGKRIMILYLSRVVGYIFPKSQCGEQYEELAAAIQLKMAQAQSGASAAGTEQTADGRTKAGTEQTADGRTETGMEISSEVVRKEGDEENGKEESRESDEARKASDQKLREAAEKARLARQIEAIGRKSSSKDRTTRRYDMPPGEAEIWGEDDDEA